MTRSGGPTGLATRLHLPYPLLSDPTLLLAEALGLPTFTAQVIPRFHGGAQRLYKRLTLVVDGTCIEHVFYPVFRPDTHAPQVVEWLLEHPRARLAAAGWWPRLGKEMSGCDS